MDIIIVAMKKNKKKTEEDITFGDLVMGIALCFLGAPYKEKTLEAPGREKLTVNFTHFDCFTYAETVLALGRCFVDRKISERAYKRRLKFIRYRRGVISGYSSRLHYFTDWLSDNERKKTVKDISGKISGSKRRKKINFMTAHRELYPPLKNKNQYQKMLVVEKNLSRRVFHVIGKDKLVRVQDKIKNGDIIAFAAKQEGLDVVHMGFALWQGRNLYLLHASSKEGAVVVSQKTLAAYLKTKKNYSGIIVARPA